MKKRIFAASLTLAMTAGLAACSSSAPATTAAPAAPATTPAVAAATAAAAETKAPETTAASAETYDLIWAGTSASSGYYALNVALCDVINSHVDGVHVTLMETGGTVDDYKLMSTGEASFGQTSIVNQYCLQNDCGIYEGFGYKGALDLCFFVPQAYRFVVTTESGVTKPEELQGKKYNAGLAGSSSEVESMNILGAIGVEPDWYPASTSEALDAISNRQIIGFTKSGTTLSPDSTITNLQSSADIQILSFSDEQVQKINELYPYYGFDKVDCSDYGLDYEVNTYCARFGFCVSEDVPDDVAYRIVKAFDEYQDEIRAAYPGIIDDPIAFTGEATVMSKIHPGVLKYMEEKGINVPEERK
ncbi:MAG: TAXI family TRAP transporter solute-binding subunit [Lachnospiraceae bacterium]|nr:TAXI family TRAP transporter solute-binding subunit [Lachnospiraceae bacterium]